MYPKAFKIIKKNINLFSIILSSVKKKEYVHVRKQVTHFGINTKNGFQFHYKTTTNIYLICI